MRVMGNISLDAYDPIVVGVLPPIRIRKAVRYSRVWPSVELGAVRISPDHYIILGTRSLVIDLSGFIVGLGIGKHGVI